MAISRRKSLCSNHLGKLMQLILTIFANCTNHSMDSIKPYGLGLNDLLFIFCILGSLLLWLTILCLSSILKAPLFICYFMQMISSSQGTIPHISLLSLLLLVLFKVLADLQVLKIILLIPAFTRTLVISSKDQKLALVFICFLDIVFKNTNWALITS